MEGTLPSKERSRKGLVKRPRRRSGKPTVLTIDGSAVDAELRVASGARAADGFCREAIMAWCEDNGVELVLGLAKNARLRRFSLAASVEAHRMYLHSGEPRRVFCEFDYQTRDSSSPRPLATFSAPS